MSPEEEEGGEGEEEEGEKRHVKTRLRLVKMYSQWIALSGLEVKVSVKVFVLPM